MRTLRGRLFGVTLASLALALTLTVVIGATLTRRQVDKVQAAALASRADDLAAQRRENPSYVNQNRQAAHVRVIVDTRPRLAAYVPDVNRDSDGRTTYNGVRELYSYRTLPQRGLLLLRPQSSAAWRPFLGDLLLAGLAGVALAAVLSLAVARSIVRPIRRIGDATRALAADESHEPLPREGTAELASLAEAFNAMTEQLDASREAERNFLLSVSHELKTPLTAIRGYAEGLGDGAFEPEEAALIISIEASRLERLVRDLLDLARMNRSEFAVRNEPVDLAEIAREAARRHDASATQFGVALVADGEQSWVEADHDRLLQVASNLVENALRESPAGSTVTVRAEPGRLLVVDTGPGIAEEDLPHVFERFYLYDKIGKDRPVGSGLGLAIVRQLVVAMGGTVSVESGPGEGATFVVALRPSYGRSFEVSTTSKSAPVS
ncbi:MAG TPA: HAMP domain-containing sensor histidine kinase [Gaiellaceae bacterium]